MRLCNSHRPKTERSDAVHSLRLSFASLSLCLATVGHSQNLIPNPSFEDYDTCVTGLFQVYRATGWNSYMLTPDYFNACADTGAGVLVDVPLNTLTFQPAYEGQAYMGVWSYDTQAGPDEEYREHIGSQLLAPLEIGQTYYASFRTSLALREPDEQGNRYGSSHIGMLCTNMTSALPDTYDEDIAARNFAHVFMGNVLTDTLNWVLVSGSFVADSAYTHIVMGNHFDNEHSDTLRVAPGSSGGSYHLLDALCLSTDPNFCPLANSIGTSLNSAGIDVFYPVGASDLLLNWSIGSLHAVVVIDALGRVILEEDVRNSDHLRIGTDGLPFGYYLIWATGDRGSEALKFVVSQ